MSLKGKVKWFNGTKGYGFIEREDKEKDVFVHSSAVREAGLKYLNEGDELTFEVENTDKGPSAVNLQKMNKHVFFFVFSFNETISFCSIEPFYFTF